MTQNPSKNKLIATALGALAIGIAAPAEAQNATPSPVDPVPPPVVTPEPAPPVALPAPTLVTTPAPAVTLTLPDLPAIDDAPARPAAKAKPTSRAAVAKAASAKPAPIAQAPAKPAPVVTETAPPARAESAAPASQPAAAAPAARIGDGAAATDDWTNLALAGGIALAGLAGAGAFAFARRRDDDPVVAPAVDPVVDEVDAPDAATDTRPVAPVTAIAEPALAYTAANGRAVGRHEAAAEAGPSQDNPFLTRRARLRHARFYDRKERLSADAPQAPEAPPAPLPTPAPRNEQVTYVFGKDRPRGLGAPVLRRV